MLRQIIAFVFISLGCVARKFRLISTLFCGYSEFCTAALPQTTSLVSAAPAAAAAPRPPPTPAIAGSIGIACQAKKIRI